MDARECKGSSPTRHLQTRTCRACGAAQEEVPPQAHASAAHDIHRIPRHGRTEPAVLHVGGAAMGVCECRGSSHRIPRHRHPEPTALRRRFVPP